MRIGINLLLWTDAPTEERHLPLYERLAKMGFDGIELPVVGSAAACDPEAFRALGKRLDDMGLARTAVSVRTRGEDPISPDPAVRARAVLASKRAVDCCEAAGVQMLGGPLYAALGAFSGAGPTADEWHRSVEVMREVAGHAARAGVALAFEFVNRFEIYLLNTTADTARFAAEIDRPNVGVHYDTFHAHIEEKRPAEAIRAHAAQIHHVHISENDRSTPGTGHVDWRASFDALAAIGYDDWLTIEAFGAAIPSLAAATKIWRRMFDDEETLARDGRAFIAREWSEALARAGR